ncbi:MAG: NAD(P)/FAD-dependent oxidoreductase, partial [Nanoarchaeota archaeon]
AKPSKVEFQNLPKNVKVMANTEVKEIKGSKFVEKVLLKDGKELEVDGVFVEMGFQPTTELAEKLGVEVSKGMIKVNEAQATSVEGVFAAGDITTGMNQVRQVLTAAAEGCVAANSAYIYITGKVNKMQVSSKQ